MEIIEAVANRTGYNKQKYCGQNLTKQLLIDDMKIEENDISFESYQMSTKFLSSKIIIGNMDKDKL